MTKLYNPKAGAITLDGEEFTPDQDGAFDIPDQHVAVCVESFGFSADAPKAADQPQTPAGAPAPEPTLEEKLDRLKNKGQVAAFALLNFDLELDPIKMTREDMEAAILAKAAEE
jgi:hypothetical protein